ncbi:glycosyltransferase family 2 protein [Aminobacter sp. UC22_36]|uniref:glycosyltransferase family 2 protein n=1 Tax=Aminobacter sp. UC22_36 TaxID=3374549 RepID=UPI0037579FD9
MSKPVLSIVSTLYLSAPFLADFIERACKAAAEMGEAYELILVDDGSPDESLQIAIDASRTNPNIRVIELSRNFGHHAAILSGLGFAQGEHVFLVDSDLEEPPELLLRFATVMRETDADVVYGYHEQRTGSRWRQVTSGTFWRIFNALSESQTQENICHVRLMKRDYLDALLSLRERNLFLGGLYSWAGFKQVPVQVDRQINRPVSTYNISRRIDLAVRSIVAFSTRPLKLIFILGSSIALLSMLVALAFLLLKIYWGDRMLLGFSSIIISIWFLGGLTIMSLGIIGLYIGQIYVETKARPRAIIRRVYQRDPSSRP